jgi:uncharacterized protein
VDKSLVQQQHGAGAVINLAGRTVNCRYHARNRRQIYDSRLDSTRVIGQGIAACAQPPRTWLNAASATIYRHALDRPQDEYSGEIGSGFSVDVCRQWEWTLWNAPTPQTRKVALRAAMVLGRGDGGVLNVFENLVRLGLGGTLGPGTQYMSWLHVDDFVRSVLFLLAREDLAGPVNLSAPEPLPNAAFMRALRRACGMPFGLPANRLMLEVGAVVLRTETELLLKSRRVVPRRLLTAGFDFRFPSIEGALANLMQAGS